MFGSDEYAGDREIAYFISSVTAAAELAAATGGVATTTTTTSGSCSPTPEIAQNAVVERSPMTAPPSSLLGSVTLRAVPVHVDAPSRRYNPYHLRIVRREVSDGGGYRRRSGDSLGGRDGTMGGPPATAAGTWDNFEVDDVSPPGAPGTGCTISPGDSKSGRGGKEQDWAPGVGSEGLSGEEGFGGKTRQEMTSFREKGVAVVNIHGETSFQSLDDWRREKERFDALSKMNLCRR